MRPRSPAPERQVDELTGRILNEMQSRFPLVARPYQAIGERVGLDEAETFMRVSVASDGGLIRQVCGIFDTRALGYTSSLVAMKVAPEHLDRAVAVVNAHPGVSHNYERQHDFNLWYTIAIPVGSQLETVIGTLQELAQASVSLALPTLRLFKIGVSFEMTGRHEQRESQPAYTQREQDRALRTPLSAQDVEFVRVVQRDWVDESDPFGAIASELDWPLERVLRQARALHTSGHLRRFAAILNHRRAGFAANGMTVWRVPDGHVERVGTLFANHPAVSHCYLRPTYPDWPYNVFAMIHGRASEEVDFVAAELSLESQMPGPEILYSVREFKKERITYFDPEHARWREFCETAAKASTISGGVRC